MRHIMCCPRFLVSGILMATVVFGQSPAPTTTPGKALGETITGVIETVFPAVKPIIEFFRTREKDPKKEDAKQKEIETKLSDLKKATKAQLSPIAKLAQELALIDTISSNAAIAEISLARINVILSLPQVTDKMWAAITEEWEAAAKVLAKIEKIDQKQILDAVSDDAIQARLLEARSIQEEASGRIVQRLKSKDAMHIREQTMKLQEALSAARNLSTIKLARMSRELKVVQEYLNSPAGLPAAATVEAIPSEILAVTDSALARAKAIGKQ